MPLPDVPFAPDDDQDDHPTRPVRHVAGGHVPTSALPTAVPTGSATPPCLAPCPQCGTLVLTVDTADGRQILAPQEHGGPACFAVAWDRTAVRPWGSRSRAMAVHRCGG